MTDPRRLLEDASGVERDLLRAGREDAPPPTAQGRAAVALGFATGTAVTTSAATAGATAATTKVTWLGMSAATVKVLGACVVSSALAAAAVHSVVRHDSAASPVNSASARTPVAASLAPRPTDTPAPPPPASASAPAQTVTSAVPHSTDIPSSHPTTPIVSSSPSPTPASTMTDQLALLDLARAAYQSGDPDRTLTLVKEYDDLYPRSPFALETQVLRIDALAAAGRTSEALAAADRFLDAHPNEPMSRHVRSVAERLRGGSNP